jgi:TonB-like protein
MKPITLLLLILIFERGYSQSESTLYGYVDSITFREAEVHPMPVGGLSAWDAFLKKEMRKTGKPGTVIVEFTVKKGDRVPSDVTIYRSDDTQLNNDAIRIIGKSRWVPAMSNGKAVSYRMRQEIEFK